MQHAHNCRLGKLDITFLFHGFCLLITEIKISFLVSSLFIHFGKSLGNEGMLEFYFVCWWHVIICKIWAFSNIALSLGMIRKEGLNFAWKRCQQLGALISGLLTYLDFTWYHFNNIHTIYVTGNLIFHFWFKILFNEDLQFAFEFSDYAYYCYLCFYLFDLC